MDERKQNNSSWIVDEFTEWIDAAVASVKELCGKADVYSSEYTRLLEKHRTLTMVQRKFEEFKFD